MSFIAYCSEKDGRIFKEEGKIDLMTCLRRKEEASMGGGVYLIVRSKNEYSQRILTTKGLIGNYDNSVAVICHPYHLCGVESSTSLLSAAMLSELIPALKSTFKDLTLCAKLLSIFLQELYVKTIKILI